MEDELFRLDFKLQDIKNDEDSVKKKVEKSKKGKKTSKTNRGNFNKKKKKRGRRATDYSLSS